MPQTEIKQREQVARLKEMIRTNEENLKSMRTLLTKLEKTTNDSKQKRRRH